MSCAPNFLSFQDDHQLRIYFQWMLISCALYDMLRESSPASEKTLLRILRAAHQHAGKIHHECMSALVAKLKLFRATKDPAVNYVKSKVFGIEDGAPILGNDHPLIIELKAVDVPGAHVMFWAMFSKSDRLCFLQMTRGVFYSRTRKTRKTSQSWAPSWRSMSRLSCNTVEEADDEEDEPAHGDDPAAEAEDGEGGGGADGGDGGVFSLD